MKHKSQVFEDFSQMVSGATELAQGVSSEAKALFYSKLEKIINEMDLVRREEFDHLKETLEQALTRIDQQKEEIKKLTQITNKKNRSS